MFVGIIAVHSLPMTTISSIETADGITETIEQLHSEFSQDVRPPCKVLCYAVTAGYSRVKNSETSKEFRDLHCTDFSNNVLFVLHLVDDFPSLKLML